ncbi:MAG: YgiQ family radical SAM protein [Bacteroidales bacterium]
MIEEEAKAYMFPTSKREVDALGWDYIDVIFFSGDAFIDHPSFGTAVISRMLQYAGYRVAVVPQPNWRDDLRDFKKLGEPRLFFAVCSGVMDSMVNHYTAGKRRRHNDAYTPDGKAFQRPDYADNVYCGILRELYPGVPIVLGGIEASLRRVTHYDYWQDKLLPSILVSSKADYLVYGMGDRPIVALAKAIEKGQRLYSIPQIAYYSPRRTTKIKKNVLILNSYEECLKDKVTFLNNFNIIEREANKMFPNKLIEPVGDGEIVINPPYPPATTEEIDLVHDLPYTKKPHPRYKGKFIPAYEMIKNSINIHNGCFGGCNFCTIAAHQGRFIQSRSEKSILNEVKNMVKDKSFNGVITDIGAPSANMYMMKGKDLNICAKCIRKSCLYPKLCPNLNRDLKPLLKLYHDVSSVPGIKHAYVSSGVRYDLFLNEKGFLDETSYKYFYELVVHHTSGRLKVAPEHTEDHVLKLIFKPPFSYFEVMKKAFDKINRQENLHYQIIPYFISSHPGCSKGDMLALSEKKSLKGVNLDQVQDLTPTPMTASSTMFYTGLDLITKEHIFVEKNLNEKKKQKSYFFRK